MSSPASVPIPGFRHHTVLGQDLMSTVWLAADGRGRTAVLAIGHRVLAGQADRGAFLACAATPSRVAASPSIADVPAHGNTEDRRPYIAVETRAGASADPVAAGAITPREAQAYGLAVSKALAAVHPAGLAHGAVGPATILLSGNRPVLSRFDAVAPGLGPAPNAGCAHPSGTPQCCRGRPHRSYRAMSGPGRGDEYDR